MTAKDVLSRCYILNCDIESKRADIEKYRAIAEKTAPSNGSGGRGSVSDKVGKGAIKLVATEKELKRMKRQYKKLYKVTERRISAISGETEREVLRQRYLYFRSWRVIGRALNMNQTLVRYYHQKALEEFTEKFLKNS